MNSFCEDAKAEILAVPLRARRSRIAFVSALARTAGTLVFSGGQKCLVIRTPNAALKDRILQLLTDIYGSGAEFSETRDSVTVEGTVLEKVLQDLKIFVLQDDGELAYESGIHRDFLVGGVSEAYLRGLFLGAGAVSLKPGYHLEFAFTNGFLAADCVVFLEKSGFGAKTVARKDKTVVYIKESEKVSDLLAYMGAAKAVMKLNGVAVSRDANRITNRRLNCDLANIDKTVILSGNQAEAISVLAESGVLERLDGKLKETARLRLAYPEMSLSDLAGLLGISKSGIRNRLQKLTEIAKEMKNKPLERI